MNSPDARQDRDERIDAILLSFVASYVDTAVFVGLFGLFSVRALERRGRGSLPPLLIAEAVLLASLPARCLLAPAALCVVLAARFGRFDAAGRVARLQL